MPWTVDETKAKFKQMVGAAERKYTAWIAMIPNVNHPRDAAGALGWPLNGTNFEYLSGRWSIRLSQRDRVLFEMDEGTQTLTVIKVGGHY